MPYSYNNYCFPDIVELSNSLLSQPSIAGQAGLITPVGINETEIPGQLIIYYGYKPFTTTTNTAFYITRQFQTCTTVGYMPPNDSINQFADMYLKFDPVIAEELMAGTILAFVSGHVLGRIMGLWRKGF